MAGGEYAESNLSIAFQYGVTDVGRFQRNGELCRLKRKLRIWCKREKIEPS